MIDAQAYPVSGRPGRYQTDKSIIYLPGKTYKLTVEVGGQVLSSKTTIPKSLNIDTKTDLKTYTCRDGTILSIPEINVNNMDENGNPIRFTKSPFVENCTAFSDSHISNYTEQEYNDGFAPEGQSAPTHWFDPTGIIARDNDGNIITFNANFDKDTAVTNTFPYVILTKRIRIYPTKWNKNRAALRVEFIGW